MTTQTYQDAAIHLLAQAEVELAAGDTRQASEKCWGAATQAVKAVCERRGWKHRNYKALQRAIKRLVQETGDSEFRTLYDSAYVLHVNFYEDAEDPDFVGDRLHLIQRLIDKLSAVP